MAGAALHRAVGGHVGPRPRRGRRARADRRVRPPVRPARRRAGRPAAAAAAVDVLRRRRRRGRARLAAHARRARGRAGRAGRADPGARPRAAARRCARGAVRAAARHGWRPTSTPTRCTRPTCAGSGPGAARCGRRRPAERIERAAPGGGCTPAVRPWTPASSSTRPGRGPMSSPSGGRAGARPAVPTGARSRRCGCRTRRGCAAATAAGCRSSSSRRTASTSSPRATTCCARPPTRPRPSRATRAPTSWTSRWRWSGWRRSPAGAAVGPHELGGSALVRRGPAPGRRGVARPPRASRSSQAQGGSGIETAPALSAYAAAVLTGRAARRHPAGPRRSSPAATRVAM